MDEGRFDIEIAGVPYEFGVRPYKTGGYELFYYVNGKFESSWHGYKDPQTAWCAAHKKVAAIYNEEEGLTYPNERPGDWEYRTSRL